MPVFTEGDPLDIAGRDLVTPMPPPILVPTTTGPAIRSRRRSDRAIPSSRSSRRCGDRAAPPTIPTTTPSRRSAARPTPTSPISLSAPAARPRRGRSWRGSTYRSATARRGVNGFAGTASVVAGLLDPTMFIAAGGIGEGGAWRLLHPAQRRLGRRRQRAAGGCERTRAVPVAAGPARATCPGCSARPRCSVA